MTEHSERGYIKGGLLDRISSAYPHRVRPMLPNDGSAARLVKLNECIAWCNELGPSAQFFGDPPKRKLEAGARWIKLDSVFWFREARDAALFKLTFG